MSVTLKIADQDASMVGAILLDVCRLQKAAIHGEETKVLLGNLDRRISSDQMIEQVRQIADAFIVAVRANQR